MRLFDPISPRAFAPNAITAAALCCGLLSITRSAAGDFEVAAWLVCIAALLDKLDGTVARRLGVAGGFGIQFDSFSDLIAFGVAPSALVWYGAMGGTGALPTAVVAALCLLYPLMTAVRLARFNVTTDEHPTQFIGLPSTLAGALVASSWLALAEFGVLSPVARGAYPWLLLLCSGLMVCNLQLPKLKRAASQPVFMFQVLNGVAIYVLVPLRIGMSYVFAVLLGYIVIGFARPGAATPGSPPAAGAPG